MKIMLCGLNIGDYAEIGHASCDLQEYNHVTLTNDGMELLKGWPRYVDTLIVEIERGVINGYVGKGAYPTHETKIKVAVESGAP